MNPFCEHKEPPQYKAIRVIFFVEDREELDAVKRRRVVNILFFSKKSTLFASQRQKIIFSRFIKKQRGKVFGGIFFSAVIKYLQKARLTVLYSWHRKGSDEEDGLFHIS